MALADLQLIEQQFDQEIASPLREHQDAVQRLAEVPGLGIDSAQQTHRRGGCQGSIFEIVDRRFVPRLDRRSRKNLLKF